MFERLFKVVKEFKGRVKEYKGLQVPENVLIDERQLKTLGFEPEKMQRDEYTAIPVPPEHRNLTRFKLPTIKKTKETEPIIEVDEETEPILKNPKLIKRLVEEVQKKVVGETTPIQTILTVSIGGSLCQNATPTSTNLCVNSKSGAGKDIVSNSTLSLLPDEQKVFKRTKITPQAFTYWKHREQKNNEFTWSGKTVYLEDTPNSLLNCDTFKTMSSGGSRATVIKEQNAIDILIKGKPSMIITCAESEPNLEMLRRFAIIYLDETQSQTREIITRIGKDAEKGRDPQYDSNIIKAVLTLKPYSVRIPFAQTLSKYFLEFDAIFFRTHFRRVLDYVKFTTIIHQHQRKVDENGFLLSTWKDWDIVLPCLKALTQTKLGFNLSHKQKKLIDVMKKSNEWVSVPQLLDKGVPYTEKGLYKTVDVLSSNGILESKVEPQEKKKDVRFFRVLSGDGVNLPSSSELTTIIKVSSVETVCSVSTDSTVSTVSSKQTELIELTEPKEQGIQPEKTDKTYLSCAFCGNAEPCYYEKEGHPCCSVCVKKKEVLQ